MFDFAWSEMAVIAVVALIAIGPKDMPVAIRAVTGALKKARNMAAEFRVHVDEMVREANLEEVRQSLSEIRNMDLASVVERHVDPDHSIRESFSDPFAATSVSSGGTAAGPAATAEIAELDRPADDEPAEASPAPSAPAGVPAFIPPRLAAGRQEPPPGTPPPAFIPPSAAQQIRLSL